MLILLLLIMSLHYSYTSDIRITPVSFVGLNIAKMNTQRCVIHFLDFAPLVDYSALDLVPKSITKDVKYYLEKSKNGIISKFRVIRCVVTIILVPAIDAGETIGMLRKGGRSFAIYPGRTIGNRPVQYHTIPHVVLLLMSSDSSANELQSNYDSLPNLVDRSKAVPLFVVLYKYNGASVVMHSGIFLCWYCSGDASGKELHVYTLSCTTISDCSRALMGLHFEKINGGKNVLWKLLKVNQNCSAVKDPLIERQLVSTDFSVANYLFGVLNQSICANYNTSFRPKFTLPSLYKQASNDVIRGVNVYPTGAKTDYRFVTSDGAERKTASFRTYKEPFSANLWLSIIALYILCVLAVHTTALVATHLLVNERVQSFRISAALALVGVVLEQEMHPTIQWKRLCRQTVYFPGTAKMILIFWLPCSFILVNHYKGMLQGNYVFRSPFIPQWSRLEQLTNFTILVPLESRYCKLLNESRHLNASSQARLSSLCAYLDNELRQCGFFRQLNEAFYNKKSYKHADKAKMIHHLEYICENELTELVRKNLTVAKTAFVTAREDFNYYWATFETEMYRNSSLQFYSNHNRAEDDFITIRHYYEATAMSSFHKWGMHASMRALFHSGIYSLFVRWDPQVVKFTSNHGNRSEERQNEENTKELTGLSFRDSDIGMTFVLLLSCLIVCLSSFIVEIFWYWRQFKLQKRKVVRL